MEVAIFDTYVTKHDGAVMHFDIIVPAGTDENLVFDFGRKYLSEKRQPAQDLSSRQCQFCHFEQLQPHMEFSIISKGYYILEMQGC
jgi:hypothetical protein